MQAAVSHLTAALVAVNRSTDPTRSEPLAVAVSEALRRAAADSRLGMQWLIPTDSAAVQDRIAALAIEASELGSDAAAVEEAVRGFLEAELDHGFCRILDTIHEQPREAQAWAGLLLVTEPILLSRCKRLRRVRPDLISDEDSNYFQPFRALLQDFYLFLLEGDARVVRSFAGRSRGQWASFMTIALFRRREQVQRHEMAVRRNNGVNGAIPIDGPFRPDLDLELSRSGPDHDPARLVEQRQQLRRARSLLDEYATRSSRAARDVDLLLRSAAGENMSELLGSGEHGLQAGGVKKALNRVRSFLRVASKRGGEHE